jgi:hypothetical protein
MIRARQCPLCRVALQVAGFCDALVSRWGLGGPHPFSAAPLVLSGSECGERVAHQGAGAFQEVCLLIHQPSELAEGG